MCILFLQKNVLKVLYKKYIGTRTLLEPSTRLTLLADTMRCFNKNNNTLKIERLYSFVLKIGSEGENGLLSPVSVV